MKRKIIKLADTTYVVSLPLKWARANNVKKGDEVEVTPNGSQLTINLREGDSPEHKGIFNATEFGPIVKRAFDAMYKRGYDEITVNFNSKEQLREIEAAVNLEAMTYEIVKQEKNKCVVRSITEASDKEFDSILRRTILLLKVMGEDLLTALKEKDYETISNIKDLEKTNNKLTHYLRRSLNKHGYKEPDKTAIMYALVEQLEKVADELRDLCRFLEKDKNKNINLSSETFELFEKLNQTIGLYSSIFFDFKAKDAVKFAQIQKQVKNEGLLLFNTKKSKELVVIHYLINTQKMVFDLLSPLLALQL